MNDELAGQIIDRLRSQGLFLAVAESLTGGDLSSRFVSIPGASDVFLGGVVAYQTELKNKWLGVDSELLERRGAVDPDVARAGLDGRGADERLHLHVAGAALEVALAEAAAAVDVRAAGLDGGVAVARHGATHVRHRILDAAHDDGGGVEQGAVPVEGDQVKLARAHRGGQRRAGQGAGARAARCARRWRGG